MAASELEIEPDLNKAPPHVEGELLKQNTKAILGKRGWRKYYFIVLSAKLLYFRKREDYKMNKEPIAYIRMSQVTEITEVIFGGVPKKHHLNCGFSIVAFHPITQEQMTINLLAETPEDMRYWVHALRYIKAYWSKMKIRETVLSDDQERKILERIFKDEEDNRDDELSGEYTLDEDGQVSSTGGLSVQLSVFFCDGTKDKVTVSSKDTTADLLEMSLVKGRLRSSTSYLWLVDNEGRDYILDPKERPALYLPKTKRFYALDHSYRVLVIFFSRTKEFESIVVHSHITVHNVIKHRDIVVQLDLQGVTNRGLFLKTPEEETLFSNTECPCEVLFETDHKGVLKRQPVGKLVIRNKALGGGRSTARITRRIMKSIRKPQRTISEEGQLLEEISEKEEAEARAVEKLLKKQKVPAQQDEVDDSWVVPSDRDLGMVPSGHTVDRRQSEPVQNLKPDPRGFEDNVHLGSDLTRVSSISTRPRSSAVVATDSPKLGDRRSTGSSHSPSHSPIDSPRRRRSKSPRRLPDLPPKDGSPKLDRRSSPRSDSSSSDGSPMRRRNATRGGSHRKIAKADSVSIVGKEGKGPTIVLPVSQPLTSQRRDNLPSPPVTRSRSPTVRATAALMSFDVNDSRSSSFGLKTHESGASSPTVSSPAPTLKQSAAHNENVTTHVSDDEDRLENVLSRSYQQEQEALKTKNYTIVDTLSAKVQRLSESEKTVTPTTSEATADREPSESPELPFRPMVIDFKVLQSHQLALPTEQTPPTEQEESLTDSLINRIEPTKPSAAIDVLSPSLLKVILLQSSETVDISIETKPMDFISLSGVCLRNDRGIWKIQEGCNYHDPLPFDCDDHTETFPLPGGIRAIYNHTHKRWHVLPSRTPNATPSGDDSQSVVDSIEHAHFEDQDGRLNTDESSIYLRKKTTITEIGKAFHEIMSHFEKTRDHSEKKRIGSDMTNPAMGHLVRGQFCSALATLLLDGLRPYRLEGLVQDDIWKVTLAFCNEAQSNPTSPLVFPDKLIIQPINSLKDLMKDNNIKFRTFVCLSMSKGVLTSWLEALPRQRNVLNKYFLPNAFLRLVSEYPHYQKLYEQMLLTLEPMAHLPFDFSIDFEKRQQEEAARIARQQEEAGTMLNTGQSSSTQPSPSQTPQRSVVVKTHAATGQRLTAGNVINAVWETSPVPDMEELDNTDETSSMDVKQKKEQSNKSIEQHHSTVVQNQPVQTTPPSSSVRQPLTRGRGTWLKKLTNSFQQLNMGGAITGTPKRVTQVQPKQTSESVDGNDKRVEALYNNIADDADELSFMKGDVMAVKEQINAEWLICSLDNETGVVPANYVRPI